MTRPDRPNRPLGRATPAWACCAFWLASAAGAVAFVPVGTNAANSRWTTTASGFTGFAGTPATLTWSIVPDGTGVDDLTTGLQPSNLIATLDATFGGSASSDLRTRPWFSLLDDAFSRWGELSGLTILYEPNDDGVDHETTPGSLGVRGDVRLGGVGIDGPAGTLAYNFFPVAGGDMALDTDDFLTSFSDPAGNYGTLRNTVMHELGHGIGLDHVNSDAGILMEPTINIGFDGPQHDDVRGAHWLYGDAREKNGGNNTAANATSLGLLAPGVPRAIGADGSGHFIAAGETDFVSISNENDTDFFSFTIAAPVRVNATLTPRGDTFTQNGNPFDSTTTSDLALAILDSDGSTVLRTAASQPAGVAESAVGVLLTAPGTYYARITGPTTANTVVQLYQLDLSATAAGPDLLGDFNADGVVDAADYTLWRDSEGAFVATFTGADHSGNGVIDPADYAIWQTRFGDTLAATAVPEPCGAAAWLLGVASLFAGRPRTRGCRSLR